MESPEWEKHGGGMGEKVCLITGATSGIGKATGLANMGASVVMVGRDRDRGEAVMAETKESSGDASVHTSHWQCSLSSLAEGKRSMVFSPSF